VSPARSAWRAFPWDDGADDGQPFSASFVPAAQGWGRFDRPGEPGGVLYLAESSEHAVAERIQDLRNQTLEPTDLFEYGHPLALVSVPLEASIRDGLADLCDPPTLARLEIRPDAVCAIDRATTQAIAARLYDAGYPGFRWWSSFFGEWHTLVLFRDRLGTSPRYGTPEVLDPAHPAVAQAAQALGIQIRGAA
jgi:hypothetical protein